MPSHTNVDVQPASFYEALKPGLSAKFGKCVKLFR